MITGYVVVIGEVGGDIDVEYTEAVCDCPVDVWEDWVDQLCIVGEDAVVVWVWCGQDLRSGKLLE